MSKRLLKKKKTWKGLAAHSETVPIARVRSHPKNPRLHDERNVQAIMGSLDEFEQLAPLVVWGPKNFVIVGNGRLEASKRLKKKSIDIVHADHLTESQALAYMIADNKTTDLSTFDFEAVGKIFKGLERKNYDLSHTGFEEFETEPLMQAEWKPPTSTDMPKDATGTGTLALQSDHMNIINKAIAGVREFEGHQQDSDAEALVVVCQEWMEAAL